jgi:CBS domain-containing protein
MRRIRIPTDVLARSTVTEWSTHLEAGISTLGHVPVQAVMRRNVSFVDLDTSEPSAAAVMAERALPWVPVVDRRGKLRGLVTLADLWKEEHAEGDLPPRALVASPKLGRFNLGAGFHEEPVWRTAADLLRPSPLVLSESTPVAEAARLMAKRSLDTAPCIDAIGHLTGVLHAVDVLVFCLERRRHEPVAESLAEGTRDDESERH